MISMLSPASGQHRRATEKSMLHVKKRLHSARQKRRHELQAALRDKITLRFPFIKGANLDKETIR